MEESQNPLTIPEILEMVLGHLGALDDLKKCRPVHSLWNKVSTPLLSSKIKPIRITVETEGVEKMLRLVDFLKARENQVPFLVRKFHFCDADQEESPADPRWTVTFSTLLELVADWTTHLTFMDSSTAGKILLPKAHPTQIRYPVMESLVLNFGGVEEDSFPCEPDCFKDNLEFVTEVVKRSPKMTQFRLGSTLNKGVRRMSFTLEQLLPWAPLAELRRLGLHGKLENAHLDYVRSLDIGPLTELEVKVEGSSPLSQECLRRFLEWKRDSLETLTVSVDEVLLLETRARVLELPPLSKLRSLSLEHFPYMDTAGEETIHPFSYQTHFPVLKVLRFAVPAHVPLLCHRDMTPLETVTEVHLPPMLTRVWQIPQVSRVFPNLRKLGAPCGFNVLQHIFRLKEGFERVEHLSVRGSPGYESWNQLLTGYSQAELKQLEGMSERIFQAVAKGSELPEFLKRLKSLTIEDPCHILEVTVRLALAKLENLKYLHLRSSASTFPENLPKLLSRVEITHGNKTLK